MKNDCFYIDLVFSPALATPGKSMLSSKLTGNAITDRTTDRIIYFDTLALAKAWVEEQNAKPSALRHYRIVEAWEGKFYEGLYSAMEPIVSYPDGMLDDIRLARAKQETQVRNHRAKRNTDDDEAVEKFCVINKVTGLTIAYQDDGLAHEFTEAEARAKCAELEAHYKRISRE